MTVTNLVFLFGIAVFPVLSYAQLSVRSLFSARHGEASNSDSEKMPAYYSDIIVEYRRGNLLLGVRGEGFRAPDLDDVDYQRLNQRYAEYTWDWGAVRAGHFYSIFGSGITLRGFELPGFIYEDQIFRTRHSVTRDFDGAKVVLSPGNFRFTALRGTAVTNPLFPPDLEDDFEGTLTGAQVEFVASKSLTVGTGHLEYETSIDKKLSTYFLSLNLDRLIRKLGLPDLSLATYAEYASDQGYANSLSLNDETPHALYISNTFTAGDVGGSLEWKDYRNFSFGINDPPPLVRENSEYLLNRLSHVLDAAAEKGIQIEMFYAPFALSRIVGNYSRSRFGRLDRIFEERYLAFEKTGHPWSWRAFADHSKDERDSEVSRFTLGFNPDIATNAGATLSFDIQWQRIRREYDSPILADHTLTNLYTGFRFQSWANLSLSLNSERTSDPLEAEEPKWFVSTNVGWQAGPGLNLQLFAGSRRRGTLCDYGFCIPVLEFTGVELRMETSF
jgi:hypothetical protein